MIYKLPLRNKNKEIIDYCLVSKEDYELLNKFKFYKNNNYVLGYIDKETWRIHRYIIIKILNNDINSHTKIDHIDNNPLNNTRNNLRIVSNSENTRNKKKRENCSSNYIGVSFKKNINKWATTISINKQKLYAQYNNEYYAAHQYNLWCIQYNLNTAKLNILSKELVKDFILYKKEEKKENLPKGIYLQPNNTYRVRISFNKKRINIGIFNTLEEAINIKEKKILELQIIKQNELKQLSIVKNKNNECIINLYNKDNIIKEIIVDEDDYYNLIQYKWKISHHNYVTNYKLGFIHRYILNYTGEYYIDHINNNKFDNRKINLRIVTAKQNSMNKSSQKNSTSKYIGVYWNKNNNKWIAKIYVNKKYILLGQFNNELEAAKMRDLATLKYFGEYGNLNILTHFMGNIEI